VTVGEGTPSIRVSGEDPGALTTLEEFENFHLRLEFRWGEATWGTWKELPRDSGVQYHCIGPHGAVSRAYMKSFLCNFMEDDTGSFWSMAGTIADVEVGDQKKAYEWWDPNET
jgi:hypothetical protein